MLVNKIDYEELLSEYANPEDVITLLKAYRPYLEKLPSLRRPNESLVTIPFPIIKVRKTNPETIQLPCEVALLMCDRSIRPTQTYSIKPKRLNCIGLKLTS